MKLSILCLTICSASLALALDSASRVAAAEDVSFAGKVITMTIGFAAGSGTDLYGRTIGQHLLRHLPGNPRLIVVNQPGAGGVVALNDWTKRAEPNGQFLTIGQQSQVDPDSLIRANAKYDPRSFHFLGGVASASQGLFVNKAAVGRLTAGSAEPVTMGIVGSTLRGGNYQALWGAAFLGWNVKWVRGYPATGEVLQALDREEIDMSSFSALKDATYLRQSGKFTVVCQGGAWVDGKQAKSAWIGDAPSSVSSWSASSRRIRKRGRPSTTGRTSPRSASGSLCRRIRRTTSAPLTARPTRPRSRIGPFSTTIPRSIPTPCTSAAPICRAW